MIREAIILAGGLGTRLRAAVPDLPKCMAPVAGRPFLHYLIQYFEQQGINRFVFALGYRHEVIQHFVEQLFLTKPHLQYAWSVEDTPLGTGGGLLKAAGQTISPDVLVLNGDTFFAVDVKSLARLHADANAECVLSLKPMRDMQRYGVVELTATKTVASFREKQFYNSGLINGGVYALNIASFMAKTFPSQFSFEKDFLEAYYRDGKIFGCVQEGYFIDIGIPEDYLRADKDFQNFNLISNNV